MLDSLRVIFMGTPDFSVPTLQRLIESHHQVVAVYSQPPRPKGRGQRVQKSPVHDLADRYCIPVFTPKSLKSIQEQTHFSDLKADIAVVVAYGLILPAPILQAPVWGCVNVHASILPRWRGAAPIQRALMAGDTQTGVTIMKMDEGLDTGPILALKKTDITKETTTLSLVKWMAEAGADLLIQTIQRYVTHQLIPQAQPDDGVTYAPKLLKEEGLINWLRSAQEIDCQVRALNPWPGAYFMHGEDPIKVLTAYVVDRDESVPPGTILPNLTIACGHKALKLTILQRPGCRAMTADEFYCRYKLSRESLWVCPAIG